MYDSWAFQFKRVQYQKCTIIANSRKIQPGPCTVLCKIRMVLKHKSASKPDKSSLIHTSHGKTMILPRANNGMQLVYSVVFFSVALFHYYHSNTCKNFKYFLPLVKIADSIFACMMSQEGFLGVQYQKFFLSFNGMKPCH